MVAGLRSAMRRFCHSVCIITSSDPKHRIAIVATAVTSLSFEPPSLLVSINRRSSIHSVLASKARFCVNLLGAHHHALAEFCSKASSGEPRFTQGEWAWHPSGVAYLADAQASIFCRYDGEFSYGTHTIFIGRVCETLAREDIKPLLYVDGRYTGIGTK